MSQRGTYPRRMVEPSPPPRPSLVPKIILWGVVIVLALTVIGWIVGAVLSVLRTLAVIAVVIAVIWAISSARGDD